VTSTWFFLSTLNYDARSTTRQIDIHINCPRHPTEINIIIIIIIIIRHESGPDRHMAALFNSFSNDFRVVFVHLFYNSSLFLCILLLFINVTFRSQINLYLPNFSPTGSAFKSSQISSFHLWSKMVNSSVLLKKCPEAKRWQLTTLLPSGRLPNPTPSRELGIALLYIRLPQPNG